jgi:hypothetical protein
MKINGNLVFNALGLSEAQNFVIERLASAPTHELSEKGRMYFNTSSNAYFFNNGSSWVGFATGGDATALQSEVDAIEASLGSFVGSNGVFNAAALDALGNVSGSTSLMSALTQLDAAITAAAAVDTLDELTDVTITAADTGDMLVYTGSQWVDQTPAQVRTNLSLVPGTNVQAQDAGLQSISGLSTSADQTIYTTAADTYATTSLTSFGRSLIDDANAAAAQTTLNLVPGTNVQAYDAGLLALAAFNTNGVLVQTAENVFAGRTITGTAGNVVVTNGDGVSANPTLNLDTVSQAASGNFVKVTLDGFGRVTGNTAVVTADVTALVDGTYINTTGDTMSGNLNMGTNQILGLAAPTLDTDAVNKAYVDSALTGLSWKNAVRVATTAAGTLASSFANGSVVDGVTLVTGNRILIKDQAAPAENGIYVVAASGAPTRASDMNVTAEFDGAAVFVQEGTLNANNGYTQIATVTTVGTSAVTFSQFSGGSVYTWGTGLLLTGNTVDINLGAGIAQLPSDEVGIDLFSPTGGALILTEDGSTDSTGTAAKLHLQLDSTTLTQGAAGLKVATSGITANELATDSVTTVKILAANVTEVKLATNSVSTAKIVDANVTEAKLATDSVSTAKIVNLNVTAAKLAADSVTTAKIVDAAVTNAKLANSAVSLGAESGAGSVSLGGTLTIAAGTGIDTVASGAGVTVSLNAIIDDLSDVSGCAAAAKGTVLASDGAAAMIPRKIFHKYTGAASTSHVITHNLNQKHCVVTVIEDGATDEMIIPQSVVFDTVNQLTVTFNASLACIVVIMGLDVA